MGGESATFSDLRHFRSNGTPETSFADPAKGGRIVSPNDAPNGDTFNAHFGTPVGVAGERSRDGRDHGVSAFTMTRTENGCTRYPPRNGAGQRCDASISVTSITPFSCPGPCI